MISKALKAIAIIYGIKKAYDALGKATDISDQMTQTFARLNILSELMPMLSVGLDMFEFLTQAEKVAALQNEIFSSAQQACSGYLDAANAVAQLGMNAGEAFSSIDEIIAFSELMNKSFKVSGADAQAQSGAMRQRCD